VRGRMLSVVVGLVLLAAAGPAFGRPDDKPVELLAPVDGAVVKDATRGLTVDFTCPDYHAYPQDDVINTAPDGYHVILSTANAVDDNGLLLTAGRMDVRNAQLADEPGHCTAAEDDAGQGLLPRESGTYYVQAYRDCEQYACHGGAEVSTVNAVTVKRTVCTDNRSALAAARKSLTQAKASLKRKRTKARRERVTRLGQRVAMLRSRLLVVYRCHP